MGPGTIAVAAAAAVVALLLLGLLGLVLRSRAETRRQLERAQAETTALRERLDALSARLEDAVPVRQPADEPAAAAYVITDAGAAAREPAVPDRLVLGATLGEPLVKVVALGHGVRRALSPESRNRIRFQMRQQTRRTRKQRRRDMKDAWRRERARDAGSATVTPTVVDAA